MASLNSSIHILQKLQCFQGNRLPVLAFHSEPKTSCGVSRRPPLLHDWEGADSVQVRLKSVHTAF